MDLPTDVTKGLLVATAIAFILAPVISSEAFADAQSSEDAIVLEEVIVTATLREVVLTDLPLSVGVLTEDELSNVAAVTMDDIWRMVPSLAVHDAPFGGLWFIIRGLTDTDSFLATESINALYLDDTSLNYVSGLFAAPGDVSLLDLQRVEVLRGPQGTLIGANAMGGAVYMISNEPDPSAWDAIVDANLSHTENGGWNYGGNVMLNQPTGENSAVRLAALYQDDDGFVDDIGLGREDINDQERVAARLSWLWNLSDNWELLARIYAEDIQTGGSNYSDDVGRDWAGITTDSDLQVVLYSPEYRDEEIRIGTLRLQWRNDKAEFYSATSFFDKDLAQDFDWSVEQWYLFGLDHPTRAYGNYSQEDFTQEVRLSSNGEGRFNWLIGGFYLDQNYTADEYLASEDLPVDFFGIPAGGTAIYIDSRTYSKRTDKALFGEVSWRFSDTLEGVFGLRWFDYERNQRVEGAGFLIIPSEAQGGSDGVSPKASLSWNISDQTMVYGLVSKGFRPGQFNSPVSTNVCGARPLIDDDELTNYEMGVKYRSANGHTVINLSVFDIKWDQMQFNAFEFEECTFPILDNVGEASSTGFELDLNWLLTEQVHFQGGVGYNHSRIDSAFVTNTVNIPSGTPIPNVPEWTANLAGTWQFGWQPDLPGYLRADAQYVDKRTTRFDQSGTFPTYREIDAYVLVNLRLGLSTEKFRTELFLTNVFDEQADLFCCRYFFDPAVSRPRTFGIRGIWRSR